MASARRWYRLRIRTLLLLLLLCVVTWSAYTYWSDYATRSRARMRELMAPASGAACRVIFRADAIGMPRSGVRGTTVDGISNYISGNFVRMNDQWLVLERDDPSGRQIQTWIARQQVLYLEEIVRP